MSWEIVAALLCLGACTGFLAGLLGIGGGMVLTPFMTMLLVYVGVPDTAIVHTAIATSLAPGILVGALLGAKISSLLPTFWISLVFVCFVGFSAIKMFINSKPQPKRTLPGIAGMFGAGTGIGVVSALVGAGGGFISVPFMVWCNVKMHNAVGTSAALGFPIAAAGTLGYIITGWGEPGLPQFPMMLGYIHLPALLSVAAASIFTAPFGAKVAHSIDTKPLKRIFACMLLVLAGYMLTRAINSF